MAVGPARYSRFDSTFRERPYNPMSVVRASRKPLSRRQQRLLPPPELFRVLFQVPIDCLRESL